MQAPTCGGAARLLRRTQRLFCSSASYRRSLGREAAAASSCAASGNNGGCHVAKAKQLGERDLRRLKQKVHKARKDIQAALKEIKKLEGESKRGTLDRRMLQSGLRKLTVHVREIPDHWDYKI